MLRAVAEFLDRRAGAVIALTVLVTVLLAVPFVAMAPTATASQEPTGPVFEARDLLAERLPWPVHHMVFVIEAPDGNVLDRESLLALFTRGLTLRGHPDLGGKLAHWRSEAPEADIHGILTLADVVNAMLFARGTFGLQGATEKQVSDAVAVLMDSPGPEVFQLSPEAHRDEAGRWVAPALLGHVLADNALLGGGSVDAVLGSDDTTKEEYARAVLEVLRGDEQHLQVWGLAIDVNLTSTEQGESAGPFIALTVLAVLLLLGLTFRSYWAVAVTGFSLGMLMVWLRGLSNLLGLENDQILSIIVPIAMVSFGVDFAFHAIGRYREELARGGRAPRGAFVAGLGAVLSALIVAMVSDAVAFLSNGLAGIESLVQFAIAASLATVSAFFLLGVFTPLVLSRLEGRFGFVPHGGGPAVAGLVASLWAMGTVVVSVFVSPLGGVALLAGQGLVCLALPARLLPGRPAGSTAPSEAGRPSGAGSARIGAVVAGATAHRALVLPLLALVTVAAGWGGLQSRASFDVRDFFSASTDFVVGLDKYDRHAVEQAGEPADIYIEADLSDPAVLAVLRTTRETIRGLSTERLSQDAQGRIKTGGGVVELVEIAGGALDGSAAMEQRLRDARRDGVPGAAGGPMAVTAERARSMVSLGEGDGALTSAATRLHLELRDSRDQDEVERTRAFLAPVVAQLQADLRAHDPAARAVLTGGAIVRQASLDAVVLAFQLSFPFAVLLCLLAASGFMRSVRYGVVSTVPVVLVAVWLYGFMYAVGYSLNVVTATIGAISIGVGIDFSVHFTMRFREELEGAPSRLAALRAAGAGTGQALAASAFSSAVGFSILAFAPMPMFAAYGLLTAVMILLALAAALLVLPSLLLLVTPEIRPASAPVEA
ncbi:MAG: MMPL family transporter [Deltaproteobacteria bacterium]|nr:MMPL family transporter [Deltaproteobacteria bacterium]